jgi:hypothetical protein
MFRVKIKLPKYIKRLPHSFYKLKVTDTFRRKITHFLQGLVSYDVYYKIERNYEKMLTYFDFQLFTLYLPMDGHNVTLKGRQFTYLIMYKVKNKRSYVKFEVDVFRNKPRE